MAYTDIDKPSDYFNTKLYTGNAGGQAISGIGFQPDFLWIKARSDAYQHSLRDVIRGSTKTLRSNGNNAEQTQSDSVTSFDSDGFTLGADSSSFVNQNSSTYVSWNWKAGTSFTNDASSTGIGDIDSSGSVSATAGFSIAKFTTTGSSVQTVAHGLGSIPDMYIVKGRANGTHWFVYHKDIGNTHYLKLNATEAKTDNPMWGDTSPTSTVFSINPDNFGATTSIGYFFKSIKGYSKFGIYTGNGNSNGTFIYTGFKPSFVMVKNHTNAGYNWIIQDNKRDTFNPLDRYLYPNTSGAEAESSNFNLDFLSNGFKPRNTRSETNDANNGYIYMAFAENPFVSSSGVPATAK